MGFPLQGTVTVYCINILYTINDLKLKTQVSFIESHACPFRYCRTITRRKWIVLLAENGPVVKKNSPPARAIFISFYQERSTGKQITK